jgi:rhomboid protease GluP
MQKSSQKYKITFILIAVNIAAYIYTSIAGGNAVNTSSSMYLQWGQVNEFIFTIGTPFYYQLFTSMFIHASIAHIAGNMLFLLIFGLRGEELFNLPEFLTIYIVGGLVGNLLTLGLGPNFPPSMGASGAIFSLFGACVIYTRRSVRQSILGALVYAFFLFIINVGEGVNIFAHLGGLAFGLALGYWLATRQKPEDQNIRFSMATPF